MTEISSYVIDNRIKLCRENRINSSTASKGNQIKWRLDNGIWIKADSRGYEGLAESAASYVLSKSNIADYTYYAMHRIEEDGVIYNGCISKDFLNDGEVLITLWDLFRMNGINVNRDTKRMSAQELLVWTIGKVISITGIKNFSEWIGKLIEFDALILNEDRHLNNTALIYNEYENKYRFMPIFDNGLSLLSDVLDYPMDRTIGYNIGRVKSKPFSTDFNKQVKAVINICGQNLKLDESILDFNTSGIKVYDKKYIRRVENVIRRQVNKYDYIIRKGK